MSQPVSALQRRQSTRGIVKAIRAQIISSRLPPGSRLPTRAELQQRFRTTPVTIQRVFDILTEEGFIEARGWKGTFVSERPPHLFHYVLVFPYRDRPDFPWPQFWHALAQEAELLSHQNGHTLTFSYGNETHQDLDAYLRLVEDVRARRLAGLIFASTPFYLAGSPLLDVPGVPRVALMGRANIPGVKTVTLRPDWLPRALDMLAERGRRRVAVLATPMLEKPVETVLAARGIPTPRYWIQTVHPMARQGARNAAHLLMSALSDRRPDALLILDDNLVPDATAGLRDAGVSVPSDLTVVAHCNFPHPTPSAVPVIRLGYDVREVLRAGLELLEAQRRGKSSPGEAEVPVVEEQDVSMAGQQGLEPPSSGGEKETRR